MLLAKTPEEIEHDIERRLKEYRHMAIYARAAEERLAATEIVNEIVSLQSFIFGNTGTPEIS